MKLFAPAFFILFFGATMPLRAQHLEQMTKQLYQPSDLKKDINWVQTTLEREHPNLYLYISKKKLDYKFDSLRKTIVKPLTPIALYVKLLHVISSIGDGHLKIELDHAKLTPQDIAILKKPLLQHPIYQFDYFVTGNRLFIAKNISADLAILKGTEILSINHVSAARLIDSLNGYITADGYNTTFKRYLMNHSGLFAERYRFLFPEQKGLDILLESSGNRWAIKLEAQQKKAFDSIGVAMLPSAEYKRSTVDSNIAYIKLRHFNIGPEYGGYQDIFADIQKRKLKTLVIDLRGNPGGNLVWPARFYSHLIDSPKYFYRLPEEIKKQKQLYNEKKIRVWVDKMSRSAFELIMPHPFTFKGKIYVLIDGGTFSAGSLLAANLKALKNVTFVGEETGGSKNVWTALTLKSLSLPTSQLLLRYGTLPAFFGDITRIDGRGLMPDVEITYQIEDELAAKDLELDWVLKDMEKNISGR